MGFLPRLKLIPGKKPSTISNLSIKYSYVYSSPLENRPLLQIYNCTYHNICKRNKHTKSSLTYLSNFHIGSTEPVVKVTQVRPR